MNLLHIALCYWDQREFKYAVIVVITVYVLLFIFLHLHLVELKASILFHFIYFFVISLFD